MIYLDTSYLVRLYFEEPGFEIVRSLAATDHVACAAYGQAEALASWNEAKASESGKGAGAGSAPRKSVLDGVPESLPALGWLQGHVTDVSLRQSIGSRRIELRKVLTEDLSNWRGWTWRRARLARQESAPEQDAMLAQQ